MPQGESSINEGWSWQFFHIYFSNIVNSFFWKMSVKYVMFLK